MIPLAWFWGFSVSSSNSEKKNYSLDQVMDIFSESKVSHGLSQNILVGLSQNHFLNVLWHDGRYKEKAKMLAKPRRPRISKGHRIIGLWGEKRAKASQCWKSGQNVSIASCLPVTLVNLYMTFQTFPWRLADLRIPPSWCFVYIPRVRSCFALTIPFAFEFRADTSWKNFLTFSVFYEKLIIFTWAVSQTHRESPASASAKK